MAAPIPSSTVKTSIILKGQEDWDEWIEVIKTIAIAGKVWEYVNPETLYNELPILVEPTEPTYSDLAEPTENRPKIIYSTLIEDEKEEFRHLQQKFKRDWEIYMKKDTAMAAVRTRIQETVSRPNLGYTFNCNTTYDMLVKLKERLSPTNATRTREVLIRYRKTLRSPRNQDIDTWLQEVEKVYNDCKKLDMLETKGTRAIQDFLDAISNIAPEFAGYWANKLLEDEKIEFYNIIQKFREFRQGTASRRNQHGAFAASFQGARRDCLCGKKHRFQDCYFLNESKRPENWRPDPKIMKTIEEKLANSSKLQNIIEKICHFKIDNNKSKTGTNTTNSYNNLRTNSNTDSTSNQSTIQDDDETSAFVTAVLSNNTSYALKNSFILDSGATAHVCNDKDRFITFRKAQEEQLIAGNTTIPIIGFGNIQITIQTPSGSRVITLLDTAFVPSFHTNVVALRRFNQKNVYWDQMKNILIRDNKTFGYIQEKHQQWVLEYNPLSDSAFPAHSAKPRSLRASIKTWHRRLGHLNKEALKHLLSQANKDPINNNNESSEEIQLIQEDPIEDNHGQLCETCQISNSKKQISRQPVPRAMNPFEKVHLDLIQFTNAYNGKKWLEHFLDDCTRMNHIRTLSTKGQAFQGVKDYIAFIKRQYGCDVKILRLDGEKSLDKRLIEWANQKGIKIERSAPYTPEQNGAAERSGGVIIARARLLRIDSQLPNYLWPEFVQTAADLINISPSRQLEWKSPLEKLQITLKRPITNRRSRISRLRAYGCRAYALITKIPRL